MDKRAALQKLIDEQYEGDVTKLQRDLKQAEATSRRHASVDYSSAPVLVDLREVSREYRPKRGSIVHALKNVSLTIHKGEFVAIMGASGSGKSTLLQLIGGIDTPSSGTVMVDGHDISHLSAGKLALYRRRTVGFVFQFFYLQPFLTVARNIEVPLMFAGVKKRLRAERITTIAEAVGLSDRLTHSPQQLSGGQIQRVAIARALMNEPTLLLADEPTGNLDSKNGQNIINLLQTIRDTRGTTIIIVTHDHLVASAADRIIELQDGEVI